MFLILCHFSHIRRVSFSSERKFIRRVLIVKVASAGRMVSPERIFIFIVTDLSQCICTVSFTIVIKFFW